MRVLNMWKLEYKSSNKRIENERNTKSISGQGAKVSHCSPFTMNENITFWYQHNTYSLNIL